MNSALDFVREFQLLVRPDRKAAALLQRITLALLDAEGPPPEPVPGYSSDQRTAIARTPKGRPIFLCHSWNTGSWTCLMLDLAPVVMGRPIFIPNASGRGPGRIVTDYQSQKFQRRIVAACLALSLPSPKEPSRLSVLLDLNRIFIAWSAFSGSPPSLSGDIDNYGKNIMDALQRAGVVQNDRTIASASFTRASQPKPAQTLEERLLADLVALKTAHPRTNQRALAKKVGVSQRLTRHLLKLARDQAQTDKSAQEQAANPDIPADLPPVGTQTPLNGQADDFKASGDFSSTLPDPAAPVPIAPVPPHPQPAAFAPTTQPASDDAAAAVPAIPLAQPLHLKNWRRPRRAAHALARSSSTSSASPTTTTADSTPASVPLSLPAGSSSTSSTTSSSPSMPAAGSSTADPASPATGSPSPSSAASSSIATAPVSPPPLALVNVSPLPAARFSPGAHNGGVFSSSAPLASIPLSQPLYPSTTRSRSRPRTRSRSNA